ncbi:hypothetical protein [Trujillonella humicola]|uniref:hypothetical protein n=1 Tax=Trujillonella humicola TaxID=3383699 RepID=UPI00390584AF
MSTAEAVTTAVPVHVVLGPEGGESTVATDTLALPPVPGLTGAARVYAGGLGAGPGTVFRFPAGFANDFHNAPGTTWMLFLTGRFEVTTSDGSSVVLAAGDIVRFEDVTGPGHRSRVVSDEDVLVVTVDGAV